MDTFCCELLGILWQPSTLIVQPIRNSISSYLLVENYCFRLITRSENKGSVPLFLTLRMIMIILEWVAISFSRGSPWLRDWTQVSRIAGRGFNLWATREALILLFLLQMQIIKSWPLLPPFLNWCLGTKNQSLQSCLNNSQWPVGKA